MWYRRPMTRRELRAISQQRATECPYGMVTDPATGICLTAPTSPAEARLKDALIWTALGTGVAIVLALVAIVRGR